MRFLGRCAVNVIVIVTLLLSWGHAPAAQAQDDPDKFLAQLIAQMTPEATIGQLFVVAFPGTDTSATSDIRDLILNYHIGGVILSTSNGNIANSTNTPTQVATLTASLQNLARSAASVPGAGGRTLPFIPLFIALEQDGNGPPNTPLHGGMTPLPSAMSLGATWKGEYAAAAGQIAGAELAATGVNLLIGPSLNVLETPRPASAATGVNLFGGDPYWVGVMGQNYVRGLRTGSQGRVAAVYKHFPGQGSVTDVGGEVDKSLEELKKVELAPFLSTLQPATGESRALADALMTSHVRYRGFFGNIRQRTAPISIDSQAMQALLALPDVKAWRDSGGVLVSSPLGAPIVRRYYATQTMTFPAQRLAQDALQAGNDVLVLSDFGLTGLWPEQFANIKSTIKFFQEKYSTDLTFKARVDDAVARILRLKLRLYPGFDPASVAVNSDKAAVAVGSARATTSQVAQDSLTLLSPAAATLTEKPLPVPTNQDSILIFTDDRTFKECANCQARPLLATDAIQQAVARLYSSRVDTARITSLSLSNLGAFLSGTAPAGSPDVGAALNGANWVVFATLDTDATVPQSAALKQLVSQRPNLLSNKKVIIFAFDVPYDLEPDVIARATAVYALYGRTDPFVEAAVRALFGEAKLQGYPPVDVDAIRYQLIVQTEPNPSQIIELFVGDAPKDATATPVPAAVKMGDTLKLRTGTILDRNGHPVPDGTQVTFTRTFSQNVELAPLVAATRSGVASISFVLDRIGPLRVRASSEPAMTSVTLQLPVGEQPSQPTIILPPTPTTQPTATATLTPAPTPTATPTPAPGANQPPTLPPRVGWTDLFMAVVGVIVTGGAGYWSGWTRRRSSEAQADAISRAARRGLWSVVAGLIGYVLYGIGAPGADLARALFGGWAALLVALIGGAIPVLARFGVAEVRNQKSG